jgi:hypothetical protein
MTDEPSNFLGRLSEERIGRPAVDNEITDSGNAMVALERVRSVLESQMSAAIIQRSGLTSLVTGQTDRIESIIDCIGEIDSTLTFLRKVKDGPR